MIEALISGKLVGVPERRTSKGGRAYVQARMRVPAGADDTHFVRITAFSDSTCAALLALGDGDALAVAGTLKVSVWTPQGGEARPNLDVVAGQVLTAYSVKRRRDAMQSAGDDGPGPGAPAPAARRPRQQAPAQRTLDGAEDFGHGGDDAWLAGGAL